MRSLFRTSRQGFTKELDQDSHHWVDELHDSIEGIKRIETQHVIRFKRLSFQAIKQGYNYFRTSDWFINLPFCQNDAQIWACNALAIFIAL